MRYRVLGPIEVLDGSRSLPLGGYRQRLVLALLLSRGGHALTTDWLVDAVWGENPPRTARKTLQVYVARLRGVVGDTAIVTAPGTYRLVLDGAELDAADFEAAAERGHRLLASAPDRALDELTGALGLWRGPPFGEMADEPSLVAEVQRLRERRLVAVEDRIDAEQALAHSPATVADLEPLVADYPERARLRAALMLGLYRSGREAEALALFDEARRSMADGLGADPDPVLADLHARILRHDATLAAPAHRPSEPTGQQPRRNPYKGLHTFEAGDAGDFFGRDGLVDTLEAAVDTRSLVVVVGASGSGKSSAVRAGLVPRLRGRSPPAAVITMTPGAHPFESLREAAAAAGGSDVIWHTDDLDVLRTMQNLLDDGAGRVLLVVDQLEELVTQAAPTAAARFIENLVAVADDPAAGCTVLATVRADFTDDLLAHPVLAPHLSEALVTVVPPDPSEITAAAVGPAHRVGLAVEPELVAELVADMTDQPGALPLFEYALTEMCSGCAGPVLTRAGYRRLGGLRGALARRAEQTLQALEPAEQAAARTALLRLVTVTESGTAVRQRATRASLASLDAHAETAIDAFDRARLLTFDQDPRTGAATVEVAHEALITGWPRLASWVQESRDDLRLRQLLADEVAEWEAAGRHAGYLLAGARLAAYDDWPRTPAVSTTEAERTFLSTGRRERQRRAAAERRASRRLRGLVAATTVVAVVASMLAVVAVERGNEAQAAADRARARDLATASATVVDRDSDLALLLALEATRLGDGRVPEAVTALHTAVSADRLLLTIDEGVDAALLPEGRVLVGGDRPRVIDTATGQVQAALPGARPALHVAASVDGTTAATATAGTVVTWDLTGPTQLASRTLSRDSGEYLWDLAVTDEGDLIAAQADTESGGLTVLDSTEGATVARRVITGAYLDAHTGLRFDRAGSVVWRPNESHLMSLDVATQQWETVVADADAAILEADEMSDGSLLTAHDDGFVRRWTQDGDALDAARVSDASLSTLAVDRTSDTVAVGDGSGRVHVWQPDDGGLAHVVTLTAGTSAILDVCVRDGLVSAVDQQRRVRVWSLEQPYELGRWTGGGPVAISPDGSMLAAALAAPTDDAPMVIVRSLPEGDEISRVPPPDGARLVEGMDFCDDARCLVITYGVDDDRGVTASGIDVVDPTTGDVIRRESGAVALLGDVDASGRLLALAVCRGASPAWVMDMDAPQMAVGSTGLVQVARFDGCGRGVAFSHDGGGFAVLTSASSGSTSPSGATVLDVASGDDLTFVAHEPGERGSVRFSDDDSMLLTAGVDGAARVWDAASGEPLAVLASDRGAAETALWVTGGRVAVSHADGTVALWHAGSGALIAEIDTGSTAPFVAVTPDGLHLVTSAAGQTQMWTLDADELLGLAASRVSRTFTPAECQRYGVDPCPSAD